VVLPHPLPAELAALLDDSKKLSAAARAIAYAALRASRAEIGIGAASVREIGTHNILQASLLAMRRALARLVLPDLALPDLVLVDGNTDPRLGCPTRCIIGGDGSEPAISAASIIAKVLRDRLMLRLAARYPGYGWEGNAGYGTVAHREALHRLGVTVHHRAGFGTVRQLSLRL
jgi:ribonuclease HII